MGICLGHFTGKLCTYRASAHGGRPLMLKEALSAHIFEYYSCGLFHSFPSETMLE